MSNIAICELLYGGVWTMTFERVNDAQIKVISYNDETSYTPEERESLDKITVHGDGQGVILSIDLKGENLKIVNPKSIGTY